ncbi:hypothetical protein [sulfur-oxidizing endosymbiont of Gigantopelta aegis]|uniref:hypothetical protein n=1 Tax=sulfur-oxidizing endosymbiont of Gigantopelta aegis TaxID=2794934 RepID=UPI0018DCD94D|nr:hypothetical protein [sulfur-oxidizing endosymbiont of Gigantopelta aegis]
MSAEINLSRSQLTELARHIQRNNGSDSEQSLSQKKYDFIRIALVEIIAAYEQEIDKSLQHKQKSLKKRVKTRRWQLATQTYLATLNDNLHRMDSGASLDFLISQQNQIMLLIDARPVIVSGPNAGSDTVIEKKIVTQFCLVNDCKAYFKASDQSDILKSDNAIQSARHVLEDVSGTWNMRSSLRAEYVTSNGLSFKFSNVRDRVAKQAWVYRILAELLLLQGQLRMIQEKGNLIHWQSMKLLKLPETDNASKIIINQQGDFVKVTIPELAKSPLLFMELVPWIQQQLVQKSAFSININQAEQFFHQSLH